MNNNPKLFCLTYAGGNASFYDALEEDMKGIEVVKLEYSGHGERHKEPFYNDFNELVDDTFRAIKGDLAHGEYALLGYSMGSIAVIELLKRILADANVLEPKHIFLAAHEPHSKNELVGFSDGELDECIKKRTIQFGGIPDRLLNNKSFWRMYLPIYRADYSIISKYKFEKLQLITQVPATIFYSETDTPRKEMDLWKRYFVGECDFYQYDGTHFFMQEHHTEIARVIMSKLF